MAYGEAGAPPSDRLTIVVTTSPIPSHPSPVLLRTLFSSFQKHLLQLERCQRLLVCDGFTHPEGRKQLCSEEAYEGFLAAAEELCLQGELGPCRILRLGSCHGYGLALTAALKEVSTEYVLVVQHDWIFVREVEIARAVAAMDADSDIKYIGMQSLTTLGYARRMRLRYGLELPPARHVAGVCLVPQLLWYDKPHVCRTEHYRQVVLPAARMDVCQNPERRFGVDQMWPRLLKADDLEKEHICYGTFFWDVGVEVVYHLSGRKLKAEGDATGEPLLFVGQLRGEATTTATFTAVAAQRTMEVTGLSAPEPKGHMGRFKGRCYLCGEKGHSKSHCKLHGDLPKGPPEVVAGC